MQLSIGFMLIEELHVFVLIEELHLYYVLEDNINHWERCFGSQVRMLSLIKCNI
jgi:hypothetical protein